MKGEKGPREGKDLARVEPRLEPGVGLRRKKMKVVKGTGEEGLREERRRERRGEW